MDGGILTTGIVASILTVCALLFWGAIGVPTNSSNVAEFKKSVEQSKADKNLWIFFPASVVILITLIWAGLWTALAGFHWSVFVAFAWPYAAGCAWGRVQLKLALKRASGAFIIFSFILTILAFISLITAIDISQPFPYIFGTIIVWVINGYALLAVSGLVLAVILLVTLATRAEHDYNASIEELKHKIEEKERIERETISDEALRAGIKQLLQQGKKVSKEDFQSVNENRIRNAMAALEREFSSAALVYNAPATRLAYRNADGVRQIHEACQGQMDPARARVLVQRFIKELGLPEPSFDISLIFQSSHALELSFDMPLATNSSSHILERHFLQEVLGIALAESRRAHRDYLGTPHLFIALTKLDGGCTQDALSTLGFSAKQIRDTVRQALGDGTVASETPILPTNRCKKILQAAERNALISGSNSINEQDIAQAVLSEGDGVTNEILIKMGINPTQLIELILASNAQAVLEHASASPVSRNPAWLQNNYFAMSIGKTRGSIRGLPAEFPIFVPILSERQMREENISGTFQELFQAASLALDSGFGLILSSSSSPFLRNVLTQRDASGVKENVAYLDEDEMRAIITSKDLEPRTAFLKSVGKQVRFAAVSPFYTRGTTPGVAFVGRHQEMNDILQNIASRSYVVLGGRRIGKTSMVTQVMLQLRKRKYREFYLDCQSVENYHGFFSNIRLQWARDTEMYTFANDLPVTFHELVAYLSQSQSAPSNLPLIFIFDEIDRLLKFDMNQENPEPLFRTFRALSQQKTCQFIFSGERRIYHQLRNPSSPLFNFPIPISLGLLNVDEAHKLIEEPLSQFGIRLEGERSLTNVITDACSRHPNLMQEMGHRIFELIDQQPEASDPKVTKELVIQVMNQPEFRKLYRETFWGQSNMLEKAISLLAPSSSPIEPSFLAAQLKQHGFKISQKQLDVALDYLTLYCIFQRASDGMRWTATHFKEIASKTIFDQEEYVADLRDEFLGHKDDF